MSEHHEQNPSGFEAPAGAEGGAGGSAGGANRFWEQYGTTRPHGRPGARNGGGEGEAQPQRNGRGGEHECLEWCPICRGAEVVRATTPPELREQWQTVQRDALVMVRGLIDAYLERIGEAPRGHAPQRVEDIPIE